MAALTVDVQLSGSSRRCRRWPHVLSATDVGHPAAGPSTSGAFCGRHRLPARRPHGLQRWQAGGQRAADRGLHLLLSCCRVRFTWTLCSSRCCESPRTDRCCRDRICSAAVMCGLRLRCVPRCCCQEQQRGARARSTSTSAVSCCTCSSRAARASSKGGARDAAQRTRAPQLSAVSTWAPPRRSGVNAAALACLESDRCSDGPSVQSDPF